MLKKSAVSPLVILLLFYQVLLMLNPVLSKEYVSSSIFDELFVILILPFALMLSLNKLVAKVWLCFFSYAAFGLLSAVLSGVKGVPQPLAALYDIILDMKFPIVFIGMLSILYKSKNIDKELEQVCWVFVFIAFVNIPFVLRDIFVNSGYGLYGQWLSPRVGLYQPQGLFRHHTESVWRTYVAAMCMAYLLTLRLTKVRLLMTAFLSVMSLMHLSTKEIICIVVFLSLFLYKRNLRFGSLMIALVGLSSVGYVFYAFTPFGQIVQSQFAAYFGADSYQDQARSVMTIKSYYIANDFFPFGSGAGTYASTPSYKLGYSDVYYMYDISEIWGASPDKPDFLTDVFWPKIIAQSGWVGLVIYLVFFWQIFSAAIVGIANNKDRASWLCATICISVLVFSFAATPYTQEFMMVSVTFFAAYAVVKRQNTLNMKAI